MRTMTTATGKQIRIYTATGKSWHFNCDSMEVALVNGKRRRDALIAHLSAMPLATWHEIYVAACAWINANPRRRAVAA